METANETEKKADKDLESQVYNTINKLAKIWRVSPKVYENRLPTIKCLEDEKENSYYHILENSINLSRDYDLGTIAEESMHFLNYACENTIGILDSKNGEIRECVGYLGRLSLGIPPKNLCGILGIRSEMNIEKDECKAKQKHDKIKSFCYIMKHLISEAIEAGNKSNLELYKGYLNRLEKESDEFGIKIQIIAECKEDEDPACDLLEELKERFVEYEEEKEELYHDKINDINHRRGYMLAERVYFEGLEKFIQRNHSFLKEPVIIQKIIIDQHLSSPIELLREGYHYAKEFVHKIENSKWFNRKVTA